MLTLGDYFPIDHVWIPEYGRLSHHGRIRLSGGVVDNQPT